MGQCWIERDPKTIRNTLRLAMYSDLRRGILIGLSRDKKSLRGLREKLEVSSTTALHALRELEKNGGVFQEEDRGYTLTKIGKVITLKLTDFISAIDVLKKHEDFWLEHDLSGIPEHLLEKIVFEQFYTNSRYAYRHFQIAYDHSANT